ncbi:MAG: methionine--tRNA ligase subunit beta, partial [Burkholderiales bacterium]
QKMSKSRGTFITAESYLKHGLNPEWLRYYYAAKLNDTMEDIDHNLEDFVARVNSDLVGKYVNIASRSAKFLSEVFENKTAPSLPKVDPNLYFKQVADEEISRLREEDKKRGITRDAYFSTRGTLPGYDPNDLLDQFRSDAQAIWLLYDRREYSHAVRTIMTLADVANRYVDHKKPWELAKQPEKKSELHEVCSFAIELFRILTITLKPVLPALATEVEKFLNVPSLRCSDANASLPAGHKISEYRHLVKRVEPNLIEQLVNANKESLRASSAPAPSAAAEVATAADEVSHSTISIDDFNKIDLRIARIVAAENVEGADKLLKLTLDLGEEKRTVFAGIKSAYSPDQLVGRMTAMVANLAPRKMKFGLSEGMLLAASDETGAEPGLFILSPDEGARPGMKVK